MGLSAAMKVEVEKQEEQHLAKISLEIPAEQAGQEYNKAWKRLGQRLNIPGFRRGKAPRSIVEKTVGVERIKQEAMDRLFPHLFADAISEHQLDIVAPPQIEALKFDLAEGIAVQAVVELRPDAKLPDLSNMTVDVPEFKLPEDAEQKELSAIIERLTTLEPVIDRASEKTDIVNIDFTGSVNGEPIKGGTAKNYRLDLSDNNFIEGFADQLVGHRIGEEFTINVTFPENYHDSTLAGKPAEFKVKINDISRKAVPELTDEVAKKVGPFESVEQLKEEVRRLLQQSEEQENTFRKQKAVVDYVLQHAEVEIPDAMVNREAKLLMEEVQQRLRSQGMSWEKFLDAEGHESTWDNLREEARKRIKTSLIFGAIAKQEGMAVNEDEFSGMVQELSAMRGVDEKQIMRQLGNNFAAAQALSDQILSQKIVDFLCERSKFNFVPEEAASAKQEKPEGGKQAASEPVSVAAAIEGEEFDVLEDED
jgi:trigger factor